MGTVAQNNEGHFYRECSNKGICDRKSGECDCFDGYTGSACQRTTCPNDCSGHGTCEYMRELADGKRIAAPDAPAPTIGNRMMACTTLIADTDSDGDMDIVRNDGTCGWIEGDADDNHGTQYSLWDEESQMGCRCDAGYSGPDCSSKKCPLGDDPLTRGASVTGQESSSAIGFNIHGWSSAGPALYGVGSDGSATVSAARGDNLNAAFAGIELANSDTHAINDQASADFMVLLGRGLKPGDWINIDSVDAANDVPCRIKSLDDTIDPYLTAAVDTNTVVAGTKTNTVSDPSSTERHFDGNDDGKIDQIVCHSSAEYPQLKNEVGTNGIADVGGVNVVIDATQVDEVQRLHVKIGTSATTTTACDAATSNGIIENMFEAIPNDVVPGIVVSGPTNGGLAHTAAADDSCYYDITFTHNPGALHPIRAETHIISSSSVGELEGTQYTAVTLDDTTPEAFTVDAFHVTADGIGDTIDITTEHYYKFTVADLNAKGGADWKDLPAGSRIRIEGTQWNDGWYTIGYIAPTSTVAYVIEPVVDEDADDSAIIVHIPTVTAYSSVVVKGTKEAIPCSGRGLCDSSTGQCQCFRGSTGLACDQQTALEA